MPIFKLNITNILLDFGTLVTESAVIMGVNDVEIVHVDEPLPDDAQSQLGYIEQMEEQPSPLTVLPSSHAALYLMPSPHIY